PGRVRASADVAVAHEEYRRDGARAGDALQRPPPPAGMQEAIGGVADVPKDCSDPGPCHERMISFRAVGSQAAAVTSDDAARPRPREVSYPACPGATGGEAAPQCCVGTTERKRRQSGFDGGTCRGLRP